MGLTAYVRPTPYLRCGPVLRLLAYLALGAPAVVEAAAAAEVAGLPTIALPLASPVVSGALEAAGCLLGTFIAVIIRSARARGSMPAARKRRA
ncbi:hypothetical protein [Acidilobus saccharovorans]|uniref:hypothetical protein n=1 Tax=Acidilobus saccharovorans TaxID=242703 RepID=UPI000662411B|nr:hypothetical protein [Acidilobus saccharovorans]